MAYECNINVEYNDIPFFCRTYKHLPGAKITNSKAQGKTPSLQWRECSPELLEFFFKVYLEEDIAPSILKEGRI